MFTCTHYIELILINNSSNLSREVRIIIISIWICLDSISFCLSKDVLVVIKTITPYCEAEIDILPIKSGTVITVTGVVIPALNLA